MKKEYFMQIKTFEEEKQAGFLEMIVDALEGKAECYTQPGFRARSYDCGVSDTLDLSPITEFDQKEKKYATWHMYRITDFVETIPEVKFDELCKFIGDTLFSKVPILLDKPRYDGPIGISCVYRVSSTDSPEFKIIY